MNAATTRNDGSKAMKTMTIILAVGAVLGLGQTASAQALANGVTEAVPATFAGAARDYWIDVPANVRWLVIETWGGVGNLTLRTNRTIMGPPWARTSNTAATNVERIQISNPGDGRWRVRVLAAPAFAGGVSLNARFFGQRGPGWGQVAVRSAPTIISGISRMLANRNRGHDDDDDDDDRDRTPGPYTPAHRVRMTTLADGEWVNGCGGQYDSRDYHRFLVPSGAEELSFTTRGGSGNCIMLVRRDALPNGAQFDRRSNVAGTCQAVVIDRPRAGVYYVRLVGDRSFRDVGLRAELETARTVAAAPVAVPAATTAAANPTGLSITPLTVGTGQTATAAAGGRRYFMVHFATAPRRLAVTARGSQGDCRLYIRRNALPTAKDYDWASTNKGADQTVILIRQLTAGTYYIMLDTTAGFSNVALLAETVATTN